MIDETLINNLESMAAKEKKAEPYKRKARMRGVVKEKSFTKKGNIPLKIRKDDGELCFTVLKNHKERFAAAENLVLGRTKEDWYYQGLEYIGVGRKAEGIKCFNKALKLDKNYVDAYNGLGTAYFYTDAKKAERYYRKAYLLTKKRFLKWPKRLEWGILENRQYLRSIHYYGLMLWRKNNFKKAMGLFKLLLKLNPNDNQGARYLVATLYEGCTWEKAPENNEKEEKMLERQNKLHKFWRWEDE